MVDAEWDKVNFRRDLSVTIARMLTNDRPDPVDLPNDFPEGFTTRLAQLMPPEGVTSTIESLSGIDVVALRANTLLAPAEATFAELAAMGIDFRRVEWSSCAATIRAEQKLQLTTSAAVLTGRVYVQALSSQLAPLVLDPQSGETVLDLAAAPGGKTLQMAAMMGGLGSLAAVEPVAKRWFALRDNIRRASAEGFVKLYRTDGREVGRKTPERFDAVMLDAPCTSEARFVAGDPTSWRYWGPKKIAESARKQKALLRSAIDATRIGGRIVYATCSFAPEENEAVVDHTLRRLGDAVLVESFELPVGNTQPGITKWQGKSYAADVALSQRIIPSRYLTGFYLAKFVKLKSTRKPNSGLP